MIKINGKTYPGNSVVVSGDKVFIDGKEQSGPFASTLKIEVTGNLHTLTTDGSVTMKGNVTGDVRAGGSVHCGDVGSLVNAGGSVHCGKVGGHVNAGGSVRHG